jgi:dihydrofolate synthase/folylpolyglutamate synthase
MTPSLPPSPDGAGSLPPNLDMVLGLSPSAMTLGLGNITALLARVGNPERSMRTAVVAGTNGKGSVTAVLAGILGASGVNTGRFTSPHVYSVTERISVNGEPAGLEALERAAAVIAPLHADIGFSYFEALAAIAFLVFAERGVEVAVLETGLGGRFDATNVTRPDVSIITSISLDHRRILGDTHEEILMEKLGVTRPGVPLLVGPLEPGLLDRVRLRASQDGFPVLAGEALGAVDPCGEADTVHVRTPLCDYGVVPLPFPGAHQHHNLLLAIAAAERCLGRAPEGLARALAGVYLPGRFERHRRGSRTLIVDVAHNDASLCAAARALAAEFPRYETAMVLGLLRRKELFSAPAEIVAAVGRIYLVSSEAPGGEDAALAPHELFARYFHPLLTAQPTDAILWNRMGDGDDHWARLHAALGAPGNPFHTVLATGSHHVVEQFGRLLAPEEKR